MRKTIHIMAGALAGIALLLPGASIAGWETGARAGFDTNVDRSIDGGESDVFLSGYLAWLRLSDGEKRLDWTFSAVVEGGVYAEYTGLDYGSVSVTPGLFWNIRPGWTAHLSPFLQAKAVSDSDQSAVAFGVRADLRQELPRGLYLAETASWTDSRANVDTYSFTEIAVGAALGVNWSESVFTEVGYRYSHGDSFFSLGTVSSSPGGDGGSGGRGYRGGTNLIHSPTFGEDVVKDRVDTHAFELSMGVDWTGSLFSLANLAWQTTSGDVGTYDSLSGYVGIGYRF